MKISLNFDIFKLGIVPPLKPNYFIYVLALLPLTSVPPLGSFKLAERGVCVCLGL